MRSMFWFLIGGLLAAAPGCLSTTNEDYNGDFDGPGDPVLEEFPPLPENCVSACFKAADCFSHYHNKWSGNEPVSNEGCEGSHRDYIDYCLDQCDDVLDREFVECILGTKCHKIVCETACGTEVPDFCPFLYGPGVIVECIDDE